MSASFLVAISMPVVLNNSVLTVTKTIASRSPLSVGKRFQERPAKAPVFHGKVRAAAAGCGVNSQPAARAAAGDDPMIGNTTYAAANAANSSPGRTKGLFDRRVMK